MGMPTWVIFALGAAVLSATVNVIDKTVLARWMRRAEGSLAPYAVLEGASGLAALAVLGFPAMPLGERAAAVLAGAVYGLATVFYFRALKIGETSRLIPLYDLIPLLTLGFAVIFLGEQLSGRQLAAVLLIVLGALTLSMKHWGARGFIPGIGWMSLTVLATAAASILSKYALGEADAWTVFGYSRVGTFAVLLPFLPSAARLFAEAVRRHGGVVAAATGLSEGLTVTMVLLFIHAAARGPISLVSALVGTHPLFLLGLTFGIGERGDFARKAAAVAAIVAGAALVV